MLREFLHAESRGDSQRSCVDRSMRKGTIKITEDEDQNLVKKIMAIGNIVGKDSSISKGKRLISSLHNVTSCARKKAKRDDIHFFGSIYETSRPKNG